MPSQDDRDFNLGNRPEGLNVIASEGAPSYLKTSSISLKQDIDTFGLAGKIWHRQGTIEPNHIIPTEYYQQENSQHNRPYRILELGAGTGYVGISLANQLCKPCQVYITDLEQVVPLIKENVETYCSQQSTAEIIVDRLHWGNSADAHRILSGGAFDLVVVSDCVYFPELFGMLLDTLLDVCDLNTQVVIGYKCRSLEKEVGFWQDYFGRYFRYEPVRNQIKNEEEGCQLLGAEEQLFVFVGTKRPENQVKAADDTFTTLLFCSMGI
ncbi:hypothetical protein INT48_002311 [Thamnidium elegans]|uniref:Uncharacterized protein n=1 Tax=Thamnidium elegans TaxID=101142 RepID=A0A8H7SU12_9FUNG|nr:hypothetical protein INT48_002311 [Thamnidium elegans]